MKSIVKFVFSSCLSICALGFAVTSFAQTSDTLKNLYQQVKKSVPKPHITVNVNNVFARPLANKKPCWPKCKPTWPGRKNCAMT
jgi:hypothetical protein